MDQPTAFAHLAIYETVKQILRDMPVGSLLDVPSGEGALAIRLVEMGFDVSCCDLYPQIFKLEGVENRQGNLDARLPYEDSLLDYVICIEGLEHIENPANAIREFSRLLRPKGTLIVSVPNIMNVEERLKWLFSGYTSHFKPLSAEALRDHKYHEMGGMDEIALHVNPIGYSEVRFLLEKNGFKIERLYIDKPKKNTWAFLPILAVIILASKLTSANKRKARWANELNSKEVLLGGNTLIFKATKL